MSRTFLFVSITVLSACSTIESSIPDHRETGVFRETGTYMLPRSIFNVNVTATKEGNTLTVTRTAEGDPRAVRNYTITPSAFSSDIVKVEQTDNLLTKISSDATDQSGNIVLNLAELVFTTASGGASLPANMRSLPAGATGTTTSFSASFDPLDPVEALSAREGLIEGGFCISVGAETRVAPNLVCSSSYRPAEDVRFITAANYESRVPGIWFRRTVPTPVRIYQKASNVAGWKLLFSGNENLFDKSALYQLEIDRAAFVQKKIEVTFASGSMTTVSVDQPSTLAAATLLPVKVARIIFAIPLAGFQQDQALTEARTKLLTQQAALVKAQRDYIALGVSATGDTSRALVINPASRAELSDPSRVLNTTGRTLIVSQHDNLQKCVAESGMSEGECAALIASEQNP
ncbi:hypothetical protein [Sinorhizobium medicae]|uniref:hypothetical protein n=1 Tax=Sinorhizobium medicae TaxID=110321 RepID=UPI000FDCD046|nr:hypothetical protein [Sinorhizobium medicae]MDX1158745.1 hypothetical protein [Sinorhizobium medicae]RVJ37824.1 hypothetical protein CN180_23995 [Sinorhizobium medicae]